MKIDFSNLPASEINSLIVEVRAALRAVMLGNQSYSVMGQSYTRASLSSLNEMLADLYAAKKVIEGRRIFRNVGSNFSHTFSNR
jgi:hypothetical protein